VINNELFNSIKTQIENIEEIKIENGKSKITDFIFSLTENIIEAYKQEINNSLRSHEEEIFRIFSLICENDALFYVVMGLKEASFTSQLTLNNQKITSQDYNNLLYILDLLYNMAGEKYTVKILKYIDGYYIYNEPLLREKVKKEDFYMAVTSLGLEQLILKDLLGKKGVFYEIVKDDVEDRSNSQDEELEKLKILARRIVERVIPKEEITSLINNNNIINRLFDEIDKDYLAFKEDFIQNLNKNQQLTSSQKEALESIYNEEILPLAKLDIDALCIPTYNRPQGLRNALKIRTENLAYFGHKYLPIVIFDSSNKPEAIKANKEIAEEYRKKGFNIIHITLENIQSFKSQYLNFIYHKWDNFLKTKGLKSLPEELKHFLTNNQIDKNKIIEAEEKALSMKNIAGKRNMSFIIMLMFEEKAKVVFVDDDSSPRLRIVTGEIREKIENDRRRKVEEIKKEFYKELATILKNKGIEREINNEEDYQKLLKDLLTDTTNQYSEIKQEVYACIRKYYEYSPTEEKGFIPEAGGEIIKFLREPDYEERKEPLYAGGGNIDSSHLLDQRKRFPIILFGRLKETVKRLVVFEDGLIQRYNEPVLRLPSDYLKAFSEVIGKKPKYLLRTSWQNTRGFAGVPHYSFESEGIIHMISAGFNGDRDLAGYTLLDAFIRDLAKGYEFDSDHIQRALYPMILIKQKPYTALNVQPCYNTCILYFDAITPTPGALFRTEEPAYMDFHRAIVPYALFAWNAVMGGHERIDPKRKMAGETIEIRREPPDRQTLFEELATIIWELCDEIIEEVRESKEEDPSKRMRMLGALLLKASENYTLKVDPEKEAQKIQKYAFK
ncbi:MAG: hypothetical protein DRP68_07440, partial [Candidatus Omnitrophota bacterium]